MTTIPIKFVSELLDIFAFEPNQKLTTIRDLNNVIADLAVASLLKNAPDPIKTDVLSIVDTGMAQKLPNSLPKELLTEANDKAIGQVLLVYILHMFIYASPRQKLGIKKLLEVYEIVG